MQNRPIQVANCTSASRRIVRGMARIAAPISRAPCSIPGLVAFWRRNASRFSGGYSFVVTIVQITHVKNAAAPM